ncbi:MAG: glucosaminidase domain-containing protein [Thermodesulfobacteriota bacterium]
MQSKLRLSPAKKIMALAVAIAASAAFVYLIHPGLLKPRAAVATTHLVAPAEFDADVELKRLAAANAETLAREFSRFSYTWPPAHTGAVPPIEVIRLPENLDGLVVHAKKSIFFRTLLPIVIVENKRLEATRGWMIEQFEKGRIAEGSAEWTRLGAIARRYRVKGDVNDEATRARLLRRVDTIPVALALAQAAVESGWGTSRFALQGNSLFGEWTFSRNRGAGLRPEDRDEGARHSVRAFPDIRASVRSYMHTLNAGFAYGKLRLMRERMRSEGGPLDAMGLAAGLVRYSQRGESYVMEIRRMIKANGLDRLVGKDLAFNTAPAGPPEA